MINRDGALTSLWQGTTEPYSVEGEIKSSANYDVIIVGAGITGIGTALRLQKAGKKCLLLEAENIGYGTTGGTTAHLNTMLDTPYSTIQKNFNTESAKLIASEVREAIEWIKSNIDEYEIDCGFEYCDAYLFAQDEKEMKELDEIVSASNDAGVEMKYDHQLPLQVEWAATARVAQQAKFHPLRYIQALAKTFESLGGTIMQQARVVNVDNGDTLTVHTETDTFTTIDIVYATHIPPGINLLHLRCAPYRSYAMAVTLNKEDQYPKDLFYDMKDPYNYYRTQVIDGTKYLIVGGNDHKTAHEENTNKSFLELESDIRRIFDVKDIAFKWSSQYYEPTDGIPYIGHLPGHSEHYYVGTGYGGNGMVYSTVASKIISQHILNEKTEAQKLFAPGRIKPVAGFTNFITHNADVVKEFVGKLFSHEKLQELAEMSPDEGKVVKYEDTKIALYKDEQGKLHAIKPTCTHMGCEVKWNMVERSWDCPCHGARFDMDGKVLNGPADRDLEAINLNENSK
jgi:glycine/D-amino acid oxidase-like deaminating enzyme/nitrite reductase/ring-hydroxylating ferredoxin subunit